MIGAAAVFVDSAPVGNLDPIPKTMTIDVLPTPDVNRDGIVNGLDIADVNSHWGGTINGTTVNGLMIANIASHWLEEIPTIKYLNEETLNTVAANYIQATTSPPAFAGEVHLQPIYPPKAA